MQMWSRKCAEMSFEVEGSSLTLHSLFYWGTQAILDKIKRILRKWNNYRFYSYEISYLPNHHTPGSSFCYCIKSEMQYTNKFDQALSFNLYFF